MIDDLKLSAERLTAFADILELRPTRIAPEKQPALAADLCLVLSRLSTYGAQVRELREALRELLSGHDNLYVAHFGPASDPRNDIAAKAARALQSQEGGE